MGSSLKSAQFLIESRLRDAARGDYNACYDLGIVYSSGAEGVDIDMIEAQKSARAWLSETQRRAA